MEKDNFDILDFLGESNSSGDQQQQQSVELDIEDIDEFIARELGFVVTDGSLSSPGVSSSSSSSSSEDRSPATATTEIVSLGDGVIECCPVCGRELRKHVHYGARICISCRAFFRRSVLFGQYRQFRCKRSSDKAVITQCNIDSSSRCCKHCRFKKCLTAGAKVSLVTMPPEEDKRIRLSSISSRQSQQQQTMDDRQLSTFFTRQDRERYHARYRQWIDFFHSNIYDHFATNGGSFQPLLDAMLGGKSMSDKELTSFYSLDEHLTKNFTFGMEEMSSLSPSDKMSLIMRNFRSSFGLIFAAMQTFKDLLFYMTDFLEYGKRHRSSNPSVSCLMSKCNLENLEETMSQFVVSEDNESVHNFFGQHANHKIYEDLFVSINPLIRDDSSSGGEGTFDPVVIYLLFLVALFDPGNLNLQKRKVVEDMQSRFVGELHRCLKSKFGSQSAKLLHKALLALVQAHEVHDITLYC